MNRVLICTATLDIDTGVQAVENALETGGMPGDFFVSVDREKQGGCKTANECFRFFVRNTDFTHLCYVNDDVSFPQHGWLRRLVNAVEQDERYYVAGPSGKCGTLPQQSSKKGMAPRINVVEKLSFFCAVFPRRAINCVGILDDNFIHYGCDSDYCVRVNQSGNICIWVQDVWVEHEKGPMIKKWKHLDVAMMAKKWAGKK